MSDPYSICHECGLAGKDCCSNTPNAILVGIPEAVKIHHETRLKYSEFLVWTKLNEHQFQEAFTELLPNGETLAFKRKADNACIFIAPDGCRIFNLRSAVCILFPYWYDPEVYKENGTIDLFTEENRAFGDQGCALIAKLETFKTIDEGCRFIGTTEEEVKALMKRALENFAMTRKYEHLFETKKLDDAFKIIEKDLKLGKKKER
jgi:Fe-S-cluster containining protein